MTEIEVEFKNQHDVIGDIKTSVGKVLKIATAFNFRGQADFAWTIKPKLTRGKELLSVEQLLEIEKENIRSFEEEQKDYIWSFRDKKRGYLNDWYLIMQARHMDYETRLIDWTPCINTAIWMAMDYNEKDEPQNMDKDGVLYLYPNNFNMVFDDDAKYIDPYQLRHFCQIYPTIYWDGIETGKGLRRMSRQIGKFFIAANEDIKKPMEDICEELLKLKIPKEIKQILHKDFQSRGLTYERIYFPEYEL